LNTVVCTARAAVRRRAAATIDAGSWPGPPRLTRRGRPGLRAACLVLLVVIAAQSAAADDLEEVLQRGGFDPPLRSAVRTLFDEAAAQGVPPELLLPRLEEGVAKRVPAGRLLGVIERELGFLLAAGELLREEAPGLMEEKAAWARTANLLARRLPVREVRTLVRVASARPQDYRAATYLYVALVDWGLAADQARLLLEALLGSGIPGGEFGGIVELLVEGRSARIPPERLVERIRETLPHVQNLDELKKSVLY
jgi:hypothetical protein